MRCGADGLGSAALCDPAGRYLMCIVKDKHIVHDGPDKGLADGFVIGMGKIGVPGFEGGKLDGEAPLGLK